MPSQRRGARRSPRHHRVHMLGQVRLLLGQQPQRRRLPYLPPLGQVVQTPAVHGVEVELEERNGASHTPVSPLKAALADDTSTGPSSRSRRSWAAANAFRALQGATGATIGLPLGVRDIGSPRLERARDPQQVPVDEHGRTPREPDRRRSSDEVPGPCLVAETCTVPSRNRPRHGRSGARSDRRRGYAGVMFVSPSRTSRNGAGSNSSGESRTPAGVEHKYL